MLTPNQVGLVRQALDRDVHGRRQLGAARPVAFAIVTLAIGGEKTPVRADSSASRGSADQIVAARAKVLMVPGTSIDTDDEFEFQAVRYRVTTVHVRRSTLGRIDHLEVDLEILPWS